MEPITYSLATAADAAVLADRRIAFLTDLLGERPTDVVAALKGELGQYFRRAIADGTYVCWYAAAGGDIVGVGGMVVQQYPGNFLNPTGKRGYILNMYTSPAYRRQGIGAAILQKLQETGREMGINSFELHATKQGEPLYVADGFKMHSEPTYRKYS